MDQKPEEEQEPKEIDETTELLTLKQVSCKRHHLMEDGKPRYVRCKTCGVGWILSPGSEFKKGHIYMNGQLVI